LMACENGPTAFGAPLVETTSFIEFPFVVGTLCFCDL
jgi:hypothetical protein